jgi:hypothetical protein
MLEGILNSDEEGNWSKITEEEIKILNIPEISEESTWKQKKEVRNKVETMMNIKIRANGQKKSRVNQLIS